MAAPAPRPPPGPPPKNAKTIDEFYRERGILRPVPRVSTAVPDKLAHAFARSAADDTEDTPLMGRRMLMSCLLGREASLAPCAHNGCNRLIPVRYCYEHVSDLLQDAARGEADEVTNRLRELNRLSRDRTASIESALSGSSEGRNRAQSAASQQ